MPGPLLAGVGRAVLGGKLSKATIAAGVLTGLSRENVAENSFDYMNEVLLGDRQADRAILGTDIGWSAFINPFSNPASAAAAGTGLGALGGAIFGFGRGGIPGAFGGALAGGILGGLGAGIGTTAPYINSTIIGDAFREDVGMEAAIRAAEKNAFKGGVARTTRTGTAAHDDYYTYDFPAAPSRATRTGATGDIVLGMYNMRMG